MVMLMVTPFAARRSKSWCALLCHARCVTVMPDPSVMPDHSVMPDLSVMPDVIGHPLDCRSSRQ